MLDIDDLDDSIYRSRLNQPGLNYQSRKVIAWHLRQVEEIMPRLLTLCQHVWVTSETDARIVKHPSVSVLPNIPHKASFESQVNLHSSDPDCRTVLFVGSFGHRVNREGVKRFILHCWPKIRAVVKDATFRVVGSGEWSTLEADVCQVPGVEIAGYASSLEEEYQQSAFTVVPLFEGGGTKIKVVESLFYGRTVVVTLDAQRGYEQLRDQESLMVVRDEAELIDRCIQLLKNPELRARLAENGYAKAIDIYSFTRFQSVVRETVEKLCD